MLSLHSEAEYLLKAKDAEAQQEKAKDKPVKNSWEQIIVGYLELADMAAQRDRRHPA